MSHHILGAFFSSQDIDTLQLEGNDTNCFVSLIVDTKGTYQAAITRKIQNKIEVTTTSLGISYEFFGDGPVVTGKDPMSEKTQIMSKDTIEYFMLDVNREEVINPLDYLDTRFEEIENKNQTLKSLTETTNKVTYPKTFQLGKDYDYDYDDTPFYEYLHQKDAAQEPTLWDDETMQELEVHNIYVPTDEQVQKAVSVIVTGALFSNCSTETLKEWIPKQMETKYNEFFPEYLDFEEWADFILDHLVKRHTHEMGIEESAWSEEYVECENSFLMAIKEELLKFDNTPYITGYITTIDNIVLS